MAFGVTVQKNYVNTNFANTTLANNWTVLVLGVASQGPFEPTLIQNYSAFIETFGTKAETDDTLTHSYVRFLLNNGVPILFKRIIDKDNLVTASYTVTNTLASASTGIKLFSIQSTPDYDGEIGNNITVGFSQNLTTKAARMKVYFKGTLVETYILGTVNNDTNMTLGNLVRRFVTAATDINSPFNSNYISLALETDESASPEDVNTAWETLFNASQEETKFILADGSDGDQNNLTSAINILKDYKNSFYQDVKLNNATIYYPQLRFVTTGGIIAADKDTQNTILKNLGQLSQACETSFRVLVDYPIDYVDSEDSQYDIKTTVREFVDSLTDIDPAIYAYFGGWGADTNGTWLPGSAGFLTGLSNAGYNVYSRRIAGTSFNPSFTKAYENIYIDALNSWQDEDSVKLNPITIIDSSNNLAVMGSATLARPSYSSTIRNPAEALDIVLVGDYVTAILNNIAIKYINASFDRLILNALSNEMSQAVEAFVDSNAITRYDLNLDTSQIGKLSVECVLYFAVGLDEIELTVTSIYDTTAVQ